MSNSARATCMQDNMIWTLLHGTEGNEMCSCPDTICMRLKQFNKRCECCVFQFVGKRSGQPLEDKEEYDADAKISTYTDDVPNSAINNYDSFMNMIFGQRDSSDNFQGYKSLIDLFRFLLKSRRL
ncbi:hypothetical protein KUTeg_015280 [Tegillarca granosa]|uniref:Uncharacterized protein n=1 Tax=Tegillarca granosa TaxID=220873 RepID=A0ABQ9ETA5_TEGGR|nr:hypothetical protein KUTeg_015280 [Tegillarca granosa]